MRRDGCRPVERDVNRIIVGCCEKQAGGFRKPSAPVFTPRITNTSDSCDISQLWAEEDGNLVVESNDDFIALDNTCEADGQDLFGIFPGCPPCLRVVTEADAFLADEDFQQVLTDDNQAILVDNRF